MTCQPIREQDEMVCARCHRRWDAKEPTPKNCFAGPWRAASYQQAHNRARGRRVLRHLIDQLRSES